MTPEQTIILNRIKDEVAKEKCFDLNTDVYKLWFSDYLDIVCLRYAEEVNKSLIQEIKLLNELRLDDDLLIARQGDKISGLEQEIERLKASRQKSIEASLEKAAKNAKYSFGTINPVLASSITDPSNIVIIEP